MASFTSPMEIDATSAERSAYVAVCTLFERYLPSSSELARLNIGVALKGRTIFDIEREQIDRMLVSLQTLNRVDFTYQTLAAYEVNESLSYSELRFCLACLRGGQHSSLFQHGLLVECPVHFVALSTGCPMCGASIKTDIETLRVSPFGCNECGHAFWDGKGSNEDSGLMTLSSEPFDALRQQCRDGSGPGFEWSRGLLRRPDRKATAQPVENSARVRQVAIRHSIWTQRQDSAGVSWRTDTFELVPSPLIFDGFLVAHAALKTLLWIRDLIVNEGIDVRAPVSRPWIYVQFSSLHVPMTVAAAALYRTAHQYDMLDIVSSSAPRAEFLLECFGELPTESAAAEIVVQHEVLGLFARCLGEAARYNHMSDIDWLKSPARQTFCPAWVFDRSHDTRLLKIRALVRPQRISRLIRRLGGRRVSRHHAFDELVRS